MLRPALLVAAIAQAIAFQLIPTHTAAAARGGRGLSRRVCEHQRLRLKCWRSGAMAAKMGMRGGGGAVEVYTTSGCKFCLKAKRRLREEGVPYQEIDVSEDKVRGGCLSSSDGGQGGAGGRQDMSRRAGGRTSVPQIFVAGEHVGGCDDMCREMEDGTFFQRLKAAGIELERREEEEEEESGDSLLAALDLGPRHGILNFHVPSDQLVRSDVVEMSSDMQKLVLDMFDKYLSDDGR
eukprot:758917-Hanusia_phi.AAC.1